MWGKLLLQVTVRLSILKEIQRTYLVKEESILLVEITFTARCTIFD